MTGASSELLELETREERHTPATHSSSEEAHPFPERSDCGKVKNISNISDLVMLQKGRLRPATSCIDPEKPPASASILSPESGSGEIKNPPARCVSP